MRSLWLLNELGLDFELVEHPQPGTLRIRTAITEAKKSKVVLDVVSTVLPPTLLLSELGKLATGTHAFVGRAAVEGEVLDAISNERLIAVVDELKDFPEAIKTVFPDTVVQICIVHLICYSMQFASWKERKAIAAALKPFYQTVDAEAAQAPRNTGYRCNILISLDNARNLPHHGLLASFPPRLDLLRIKPPLAAVGGKLCLI